MKAAVSHEVGKPLVIEDVVLRPPQRGEVQVKLDACAICHSDIAFIDGAWTSALPAVFGHEAAGRITALGEGTHGYKIGDTVLVTLIRACGQCASCADAAPTSCETAYDRSTGPLSTVDGGPLDQGLATGAFAESVVVDQSQIAPIPADMPMDAACLLSCGVITGVGAVTNTAKVKPGSTVVVIGAGGVGLNAIQGAVIAGAAKIIAIDMTEEKLDNAMEFGATHGVLATNARPHKDVRKITNGLGADYVFVTVGVPQAYDSASKYLAPRGAIVAVGMPPLGATSTYQPLLLADASQSILGSKMGGTVLKRDIPYLIDLYQQGRLKLDELVTRRYSLDQINEAIADTKAGNTRRNVIVFD